MHQHDRRLGRVDPVMEESTLFRAEAIQIVALASTYGTSGRRQQSERIHHQMSGGPGGFNGQSRCHPRQVRCYEARQVRQ